VHIQELPVLDLADIFKARQRIAGIAVDTPLLRSEQLSQIAGSDILLKLEGIQPTGAFKIRGATNALAQLSAKKRSRGVVCCSTGNHGRALAYAARRFGIQATICVSELVPPNKLAAIEAQGARICRNGKSQDAAQRNVETLVTREGLIEVPPFDSEAVVAGQGTIALELLEERPDLETIVVPLSGGGLIGGIAFAAKTINPRIRVVGVSMDRGAAMHESLSAGQPIEVCEVPSLADSLGGGIGLNNRFTFELCRRFVDETVLVSEAEIYKAMRSLFLADRIVAEGGGAVGVAALQTGRIRPSNVTALIISGQNVDMSLFLQIANGENVTLGEMVVKD
jgi:threonine dehydratase